MKFSVKTKRKRKSPLKITAQCRALGEQERLRDGVPCGHPGCLSHRSHPCEGCGRVGLSLGGRKWAPSVKNRLYVPFVR